MDYKVILNFLSRGKVMLITQIEDFKNHKIRANRLFDFYEISNTEAYEFVKKYHYLKDARFFAIHSYGLFYKKELVGVATFSLPQGNVALKGWFGLPNSDKSVLELSRLCVNPELNGTNATSYLLSSALSRLNSDNEYRAVITLADSSRHVGSIYQVCNFKYYGLTDIKSDFFREDGKKNPRGSTKNTHGVWLPRTRKHRYCYVFRNKIAKGTKVLYEEQPRPKKTEITEHECCHGTGKVFDKRFGEWYTCPYCSEKFERIKGD